jgi:hypothetical protein
MEEINLKRKNNITISCFLMFNIFLYLIIFSIDIQDDLSFDINRIITLRTIWIFGTPFLLFIINGIIASDQKAALVFWKTKHTLPGHRAFSKHAALDSRIDLDNLSKRFGKLPEDPISQNKLWYKIYRKNSESIVIQNSHKNFLLARDLASISALIALVSFISLFLIDDVFKWVYLYFSILQYLILVKIAQTYGVSFVRNVLAIESSKF